MDAAQAQIDTAGQNIANAANPNYAVETVQLNPMDGGPTPLATGVIGPGSFGAGVNVAGVTQNVPQYLVSNNRQALADSAYANQYATQLQNAETLYQEPSSSSGLSTQMSTFYNDLNVLAQDPSNAGAKSTVVGQGQSVATAFNNLAAGLNQARGNVIAQIQGTVTEDNNTIAQVAKMNATIQQQEIAGNTPNALLDQRTGLLNQLATDLGATVTSVPLLNTAGGQVMSQIGQPVNTIQVALPNGTLLVNGTNASTLGVSTTGVPSITVTSPTGTTGAATFGANQGGNVGALLTLVGSHGLLSGDGAGSYSGSWLNQLDHIASQFASQLNGYQTAGYAPSPTTGTMTVQTGNPLFLAGASATATITAANLTVNPTLVQNPNLVAAAQSTNANDGSNAQAMANLGSSASGALSQYQLQIGAIGTQVADAASQSTTQQAVAAQAQQSLESVAGVNVNQEVVNLSFAAQTYQALAKTMGTMQSAVSSLLNAVQ